MKLTLTVNCDTPAFEGKDLSHELKGILHNAGQWVGNEAAPAILVDGEKTASTQLRDSNGVRVAEIVLTTEK